MKPLSPFKKQLHYALSALIFAAPFLETGSSFAGGFRNPFYKKTSVEQLAEQIDELEEHIETYGTVVAKTPDVWGEARLTKYRVEYEELLEKEKDKFEETINAAISRSDEAFFASALALQAAASEGEEGSTASASSLVSSVNFRQDEPRKISVLKSDASGEEIQKVALEPTIRVDQFSRYLNHLHQLRRINDSDDISDSPGYALHLVRIPVSVLPGKKTREGYGAEITITAEPVLGNDLLKNTFRSLAINDLADQLTFPLTRYLEKYDEIQQKLEEGKQNEKELQKHEEELEKQNQELAKLEETLKRTKVVISQIDRTKETLKKRFEEDRDSLKQPLSYSKSELEILGNQKFFNESLKHFETFSLVESPVQLNSSKIQSAQKDIQKQLSLWDQKLNDLQKKRNKNNLEKSQSDKLDNDIKFYTDLKNDFDKRNRAAGHLSEYNNTITKLNEKRDETEKKKRREDNKAKQIEEEIKKLRENIEKIKLNIELLKKNFSNDLKNTLAFFKSSNNSSHRSLKPYPASQLFDIYEINDAISVGNAAQPIIARHSKGEHVLLLDVQKWLIEELEATYDYLNAVETQNGRPAWEHASPYLADQIRKQNIKQIEKLRKNFFDNILYSQIHAPTETYPVPHIPNAPPEPVHPISHSVPDTNSSPDRTHTQALAWAIIVETALLDARLKDDIRNTASSKRSHCLNLPPSVSFTPEFHQDPLTQDTFKQYVRCRWPIHVFAVDPVTQDQNIADSFSQRREMQLALSLSFAQGNMSASKFMRYARRLDLDMDTVALNRTVVGFSHGDDTFGWRFYPRVQTPETRKNLDVLVHDLIIGGPNRDKLLSERRLEPGKRECVALVIMPSFVPYAMFDMRSNWFKLTDPSDRELTLKDTVKISEEIKEMDRLMVCCNQEANRYRQGEVYRLKRTVTQLERRLPLQTSYVAMPFETTAGGFEILSQSTTALGPQLDGFYGQPGFDQALAACIKSPDKTPEEVLADAKLAEAGKKAAEAATKPNDSAAAQAALTASKEAALAVAAAKAATCVNCEAANKGISGVEIFLVGDNFSVHETKVIAGNRTAKHELLSRRIMKITIPKEAQVHKHDDKLYVEVHVATPYGISNHLEIPVIAKPTKSNPAAVAASAAIKTHEKEYHTPSFKLSLSNGDFSANVKILDNEVRDFNFIDGSELVLIDEVKDINFVFNQADLPAIELAFSMKVTGKNSQGGELKKKELTVPIGTWTIPRNQTQTSNQYWASLDFFKDKIKQKISNKQFSGGIEKLELTAFIRSKNEQLPITKLEKKISINVTSTFLKNKKTPSNTGNKWSPASPPAIPQP